MNVSMPVSMYLTETWTIGKAQTEKLEASEIWLWRRLAKISWKYNKNHKVLQLVKI